MVRCRAADTSTMWRRLAVVVVGLFLVASGTASGGSRARSQFAAAEIEAVVAAGLMGPSVAAFRPDDPLTSSELAVVVSSLGGPISVADPYAPVSRPRARRPARHAHRAATRCAGGSGRRGRRRVVRAAVARNGDGRALARLPRESSPRGRRARARGHRSDYTEPRLRTASPSISSSPTARSSPCARWGRASRFRR